MGKSPRRSVPVNFHPRPVDMFEIAAGGADKNPSFDIHADLRNINFHGIHLSNLRGHDTREVNVCNGATADGPVLATAESGTSGENCWKAERQLPIE